jgi:hypothetical protein
MVREELLNHVTDMATLLLADCLENMDMDGVGHEDLRGFKGYSFHLKLPLGEYPVCWYLMGVPKTGIPHTYWMYDMK